MLIEHYSYNIRIFNVYTRQILKLYLYGHLFVFFFYRGIRESDALVVLLDMLISQGYKIHYC